MRLYCVCVLNGTPPDIWWYSVLGKTLEWLIILIRTHFRQGDALTDEAYEFPDEKFGMDRHFEVEIRKDLGKAWLKIIVESRIRKEREYALPDESGRLKDSIRRLLDLKFKMLKIDG